MMPSRTFWQVAHCRGGRERCLVDVGDGLQHALAEVAVLVAVAEFAGFVFAGGGAGGDGGAAEGAAFEEDVDFDGGIAAGIDDFAAGDFPDTER